MNVTQRVGQSVRIADLTLIDRHFELPLDHARSGGPKLEVFARELVADSREQAPLLVFLQGGPGFESPRPTDRSGWIDLALEHFRVLLLDQRGTGRSTPIEGPSLAALGNPAAQAEHLAHFRADSIVRDAEMIRSALLGPAGRWSLLGQSFGGFCATTYLSFFPEYLDRVYITGGLPPLETDADLVYRRTFETLETKQQLFFERFPAGRAQLDRIAEHLRTHSVRLPSGDPLDVRRLQALGMLLGVTDGFEQLHWLLERAFLPTGELTASFLRGVENAASFDTNPLYAALHESCYAEGRATAWAAARVRAERPAFDDTLDSPLLTSEMVFPHMFEDQAALRPFAAAADLLAKKSDWPPLYDPDQLARNTVPVAAAVYTNDLFVDRELSLQCAARIAGLEHWRTDAFEHNGLRAEGRKVLGKLFELIGAGLPN